MAYDGQQQAEPVRHGVRGHVCRPAGRGNGNETTWMCPDCTAVWMPARKSKGGVGTITWERTRADLVKHEGKR